MATKKKKAPAKKVSKKAAPKKAAQTKRQPGNSGLVAKVQFAKSLVKTTTRGVIIDKLTSKWPDMSPNYAATVVQLARKEAGVSGRTVSAKKSSSKKAVTKTAKKSASKKETSKPATKQSAKPAAKKKTKSAAVSGTKKQPVKKSSAPVDEDLDFFPDEDFE